MSLRRIVVASRLPHVQQLAQQVSQEIFVADDLAEALDIVETTNPDLIIFDDRFNTTDIEEFLDRTDKNSIDVPVIMVGDSENKRPLSTKFIKRDIYYLQNQQDHSRLKQIAENIKSRSKATGTEKRTGNFFAEDCAASVCMVGRSKAVLKTLKMLKLVAASRCNPVLIVGETGTGKELAAKAIHILRHPKEQLVAVNCAGLTANLLESELFGHVKGSFTGADREKTGLLELAGSGTLFFDEISEMPLDLQAKLLRLLQEKTFRKVGGIQNITCKATIMASSNRNLQKEVQAKRFRQDLYYRLNTCPVSLLPLRSSERKEDIRLLAEYFVDTSTICPEKRGRITSLTELAILALEKHDWPGNVRELRNVIERAIILETTDKIGLSSIVIDFPESAWLSQKPLVDHNKDFSLEKAERELIARALQQTDWHKTKAATLLGITRATLYAKVKQHNIAKVPFTAEEVQNEISTHLCPSP
jgi:two-component system response regulator AtoC